MDMNSGQVPMPGPFVGRTVIVSAAASGAGAAIARSFAHAGARVAVCDVSPAKLDKFSQDHPDIHAFECDLADAAQTSRFAAKALEALGGLDVLVNNAGVAGPIETVEMLSLEGWSTTLAINLTSQFLLAKAAVAPMRARGGGAIINISSTVAYGGAARRSPYVASKWAVIGFTKSLAKEVGAFGIRVNAICPGWIEGERMERLVAERASRDGTTIDTVRSHFLRESSLNTMVQPDDVASMVMFLASPAAARMSGHVFPVDADST